MKKILLIDDDIEMIHFYQAKMKSGDYQLHYANNTVEGYRILDRNEIDLVICDYFLQEDTGLDFINAIASRYHKNFHCLILSNYSINNKIDTALKNKKIAGYYNKPISPRDFDSAIHKHI